MSALPEAWPGRALTERLVQAQSVPALMPSYDRLLGAEEGALLVRTVGPELADVHPLVRDARRGGGPVVRGVGRAVLCAAVLVAAACGASDEATTGVWAGEERSLPGGGTLVINPEPGPAPAPPGVVHRRGAAHLRARRGPLARRSAERALSRLELAREETQREDV